MDQSSKLLGDGRTAVAEAGKAEMTLRMMGGVGILARCPSAELPPLAREYNDLDFFGRGGDSARLIELFEALGYTSERRFNSLHGHRRLLFKADSGMHIDVLLDQFEMCHKLDLRDRLATDEETLSLADLAMTKLQVVEANAKDLTDIVALFVDHGVSQGDDPIDGDYIAETCATDWGLYKTVTLSIERTIGFLSELDGIPAETVEARLRDLATRIEERPKTRRWRGRARLGERARWYELPEEM